MVRLKPILIQHFIGKIMSVNITSLIKYAMKFHHVQNFTFNFLGFLKVIGGFPDATDCLFIHEIIKFH